METAEAMLVFNKYDEMVELIQRLAIIIANVANYFMLAILATTNHELLIFVQV